MMYYMAYLAAWIELIVGTDTLVWGVLVLCTIGGSKERNTPPFLIAIDANRDGIDYREGMT